MQKVEKIGLRMSSAPVAPVMAVDGRRADKVQQQHFVGNAGFDGGGAFSVPGGSRKSCSWRRL